MARKNPPRLMLGPLTGRIYIATRYRIIDENAGTWEALEKYDVTNQFMAVKEEAEARFNYSPVVTHKHLVHADGEHACTDRPGETCADPACPVHGESNHNLMTERQAVDEGL